jgi:hypothetical protein
VAVVGVGGHPPKIERKTRTASCSAGVSGRWARGRDGTLLRQVDPLRFEEAPEGRLMREGPLFRDGALLREGALAAEGARAAEGALAADAAEAPLARAASKPIMAGAA